MGDFARGLFPSSLRARALWERASSRATRRSACAVWVSVVVSPVNLRYLSGDSFLFSVSLLPPLVVSPAPRIELGVCASSPSRLACLVCGTVEKVATSSLMPLPMLTAAPIVT